MDISDILSVAYVCLLGLHCYLCRYQSGASPVFWYPLSMGLIAVGTIQLIDFSHPSDYAHIVALFGSGIGFSVGVALYLSGHDVRAALRDYSLRSEVDDPLATRQLANMILVVSLLVTAIYFHLVGYNIAWRIFSTGFESGDHFSEMRLASYSGDRYLAPGYVNQFKNVLLPLVLAMLVIWIRRSKGGLYYVSTLLFAIVVLYFALLGTGQRIYVFYAAFALIFGLVLLALPRRPISSRTLIFYLAPVLIVYYVFTAAYKDSDDIAPGGLAVIMEMVNRVLVVQQEGGLVGFRYVHELESVFLLDWVTSALRILPGVDGDRIAHIIHGVMYGTEVGTVPLSVVGSAYYNGRVWLSVLYHVIIGYAYGLVYHRFLKGERSVFRSMAYGAVFFYLSVNVIGSPASVIDNGILAVLGLMILNRFFSRRESHGVSAALAARG